MALHGCRAVRLPSRARRHLLEDLGSLAEIAEQIAPIAAEHLDASTLAELRGLSQHAEIDEARLLLANLYYDAFRILIGCTAFAIDAPTGPIHARNLDWWAPNRLLTSTTWITAFEYGAMGPFETVGWPGMIGAFSGIAKGRFAVTMNAVVSREPAEPAASIAMLIRHAFETCADFDAAVALLSATKITADCLLLVSPPGSHGPTSTGFTGSHVPTCRKGALLDAEPPRSDRA